MASPLPEFSMVMFMYWLSVGVIALAFVAGGDGGIDAGKGPSLAWYIVLLFAGILSVCWIVFLYMAAPNKNSRLDCNYRAAALSMALPTFVVAGVCIIGGISSRYGDQLVLSVLASFWLTPLVLWPFWLQYAYQHGDDANANCPFSL